MKQAQELGGKMQQLGEQLRARHVTGTAGGGLLEIEMNGACEVLACRIDPQLLQNPDKELLEDLVRSAVNQAVEKAQAAHGEAMQALTGGISLPGLDTLLSRLPGVKP
ncbi:MAG: YbaB/EbfC family nucleoid-associated protein [Pirellulales bacterium]|nr:YbaB/EbfC family nucleoid-associated protein [Pirellulales bacterium]